ncbi:MAG: TfoX/Sxy family protein [Proteobacteria bacterium]|nr:TfoX/Sxy family protein [Pseudomonadota bacterium]
MPISNETQEFVNYVVDLMQLIGPVMAKRMFGGHGIFLDGLMFGLIADGILYLKADKGNETEFIDRGLEAFKYSKKGKEYSMSYYQAPDEALEDSEVMNHWANTAYNTALKAATKNHK